MRVVPLRPRPVMKIGFTIAIWFVARFEISGSFEGLVLMPRDIPLDLYIAASIHLSLPEGEGRVRVLGRESPPVFRPPHFNPLPFSARGEATGDFFGAFVHKVTCDALQ